MMALLIKVTVALAVSLLSVRLARRSRAAVRHALLASGFAIVLVLPMVSIVSPMIAVPLPIPAPVEAIDFSSISLVGNTADQAVTAAGRGTGPTAAGERRISLGALLVSAWAAGGTIFMVPVLAGLWEMHRIRRGARRAPQLEQLARHLARRVGMNRLITVLMHDGVAGPMTCGVLRPAIILPAHASDWPDGDVNRALVHELEHVRRGDWVTHCVARIVCALYWFHPLVWIAWRELVFEAERACDDAVVICTDAEPYADQLLSLAQRLSAARRDPQLAMANSRDLSRRVLAVLDEAQQRGRAGRRCLTTVVAGAVVLIGVLAPLSVVGRAELLSRVPAVTVSVDTANRPRIEPPASTAPLPLAETRRSPRLASRDGQGDGLQDAASARFDVASIRRCAPDEQNRGTRGGGPSPGRIAWGCFTVLDLVAIAYLGGPLGELTEHRRPIVNGMDWIRSERYTISALAEGNPPRDVMTGPMLRTLLEERFKLAIHRETREVPIYRLLTAANGARLHAFVEGAACAPWGSPEYEWGRIWPAPPRKPPCDPDGGFKGLVRTGRRGGNGTYDRIPGTLDNLAVTLGDLLRRPVVNATTITGKFDLHLEFSPDGTSLAPDPATAQLIDPPTAPSIFTALQEQLGLRLEAARGPWDFLVIGSVERPTEN
jgi:uncharacterized protein (TIGR03435 family)